MSLRHAILTALSEKPSSGFDLARRFDKSIQFFWSATHQQVYRELAKLEGEGFIEGSLSHPVARGNPKVYTVLPVGRHELVRWVSAHDAPRPVRDPLLIRLRAAAIVGVAPVIEELQRHLLVHEAQHAEYLDIARRDFDDPELESAATIHRLILEAGIEYEQCQVAWIHRTLAVLDQGSAAKSSRGQRTTGKGATGPTPR